MLDFTGKKFAMESNRKDRKFMELAVEQMNKSRSEHSNKIDPLVGSVLVDKSGSLLDKAHRGELRSGNHAEYTLLERILPDRSLDGATLYVTLEPCTRRSGSKQPCAERIVSARIRKVYIGMPDPNPDIQGQGIAYLVNNGVQVDFFDLDLAEKIREAVVNAIVHRDYQEGAKVFIQLLKDRFIIRSPGLLVRPLTLKRIREFNAPPFSRNPRIALTFRYMGLMEEKGSGLARMRDSLKQHGLRPPLFEIDSGYFVVTFHGEGREWDDIRVAPELMRKLKPEQRELVELIMNRGRITSRECAENFSTDTRTARRYLNKLREQGIIERRGSGPGTYYVLSGS